MCYDDSARPPFPPVSGGSGGLASSSDLTLTSDDGTEFMAYSARAAEPTGTGMVILPDVRGWVALASPCKLGLHPGRRAGGSGAFSGHPIKLRVPGRLSCRGRSAARTVAPRP